VSVIAIFRQLTGDAELFLAQLQTDGEVEREADIHQRSREPGRRVDRREHLCNDAHQDAYSDQIRPRQQVHPPNEKEDNARNRGKEEHLFCGRTIITRNPGSMSVMAILQQLLFAFGRFS